MFKPSKGFLHEVAPTSWPEIFSCLAYAAKVYSSGRFSRMAANVRNWRAVIGNIWFGLKVVFNFNYAAWLNRARGHVIRMCQRKGKRSG